MAGHRFARQTVPGQTPDRSLLGMPVCVSEPWWNLDPHPGLCRPRVLAGAEMAVAGAIRVVAERQRGVPRAPGASGTVAAGGGQSGNRSRAGVAKSQLKQPKQKPYVLLSFLACCGYAGNGNVALPRAN